MGNDQSGTVHSKGLGLGGTSRSGGTGFPELPSDRSQAGPETNEQIKTWDQLKVESWARAKLRSKFADKLLANGEWDGERLLELNDRKLDKLGFKLKVHRTKILNERKKLLWSFNSARVLGVFNFMDKNKNGGIDIDEFRQSLEKLKIQLPKETTAEECFDEIDADSNSRIDFEEFKDFIFLILERGLREGAERRKLMRSRASSIGSALSSRRTSMAGGGDMEALETMVGRLIHENKQLRTQNEDMLQEKKEKIDPSEVALNKPKASRMISKATTSDMTISSKAGEGELEIPLRKDDPLWKKLVKHLITKHDGLSDNEKSQLVDGDITCLNFKLRPGSAQPKQSPIRSRRHSVPSADPGPPARNSHLSLDRKEQQALGSKEADRLE